MPIESLVTCPSGNPPPPAGSWRYLYPSEYLTYGLGSAADVITRPTAAPNGVKEFKITDHLGSTRVAIKEPGTTQRWDYEPYGDPVAGLPPRKGFIDKEVDKESDLGDFGVRKYDDEIGRFLSTDPLWEKYRAWTPYQYGLNNPVNNTDPKGDSVVVLLDKNGAQAYGHMAILIGNEKDGWQLFSKNGGASSGSIGESEKPQYGDGTHSRYATLSDFWADEDERQSRYDVGVLIETDSKQDKKMAIAAKKEALEYYDPLTNSCVDLCTAALKAGGLYNGEEGGGDDWKPKTVYARILLGNEYINVTPGANTAQRNQNSRYGPVQTE